MINSKQKPGKNVRGTQASLKSSLSRQINTRNLESEVNFVFWSDQATRRRYRAIRNFIHFMNSTI